MAKITRTDAHRPSTIIPANYEQWCDYALASQGLPSMGVDCALPFSVYDSLGRCVRTEQPVCVDSGRCCVRSTERHARAAGHAVHGAAGRCGVCGARYTYGTAFRHESGEIVHMGHDCARKYEILADWSVFDLGLENARKAYAKAIERAKNDKARQDFLDAHPGLADAFTVDHRIIADIKARFTQWCSISDKQVALVLKIANEIRNPAARPTEINVPAPAGRVTFTGVVVSSKVHSGDYGDTVKLTVKVTTDAGTWLCWVSQPAGLAIPDGGLRGATVTLTATLTAGKEPHFAFGKRPTVGAATAKVRKAPKSKAVKLTQRAPEMLGEGPDAHYVAPHYTSGWSPTRS